MTTQSDIKKLLNEQDKYPVGMGVSTYEDFYRRMKAMLNDIARNGLQVRLIE